jgi:hypothetical protein
MGGQLSSEATAGIVGGNHPVGLYPVPWGEWSLPITYFMMLSISLNISLLFASRILARVWMDAEDLPYPMEEMTTQMFSWTSGDGQRSSTLLKKSWFWIGVLVGFLGAFIETIGVYWPPGVPWMPPHIWELGIMSQGILPFMGMATFYPWAIGLGLIVPLNVSVSVPLFWVIFYVILWIPLASIGVLGDPTVTKADETAWMNWNQLGSAAANKIWSRGYEPLFMGLGYAIAIIPLIIHWRTLMASLKSKEDRIHWIGWLGAGLVFVALQLVANIPIHFALAIVLFMGLQYTLLARMLGETGGMVGIIRRGIFIQGAFEVQNGALLSLGTTGNPSATYPATLISNYYMSGAEFDLAGGYYYHSLYPSLSGLKVERLTKAIKKNTLIAQLIAIPIGIIIAGLWWIFAIFYRSGSWIPTGWISFAQNLVAGTGPRDGWLGPMNTNTIMIYIVGFAIGAALYLSRLRFGGILTYISPGAAFLVCLSGPHLWLPFLVATIIKIVVSKIGGTTMTQQKLYPLGAGLVVGFGLSWVSASIITLLKDAALLGLKWWP